MRAGPRPARSLFPETRLRAPLLRNRALIAARRTGWRDDLHPSAARRRLLHLGVDIRRRTDHAIRVGELVAQILARVAAADRPVASTRRARRPRSGAVWIAGPGLGGLCGRYAGPEQDETR